MSFYQEVDTSSMLEQFLFMTPEDILLFGEETEFLPPFMNHQATLATVGYLQQPQPQQQQQNYIPDDLAHSVSSSVDATPNSVDSGVFRDGHIDVALGYETLQQDTTRQSESLPLRELDTETTSSLVDSMLDNYTQTRSMSPASAYSSPENRTVAIKEAPQHRQAQSSTPSTSPSPSSSTAKSRAALDSRLSLVRLGQVLKTSSLEETIAVEKCILDIFSNDLGFPLGKRTWIRDTTEQYRHGMIDALQERVCPMYPTMTKDLLETVVKRATYAMMQGRLRKERRAATKRAKKLEAQRQR